LAIHIGWIIDPARQVLSDQAQNFQHRRQQRAAASADGDPGDCGGVNFEDANLNVSVPVFIVHGNHDDPLGREGLSALDVLDSAGLVNLFGKHDNVETVELSPILMAKGSTRLALYGLGNIRDERLHDLFVQQAVTVLSPEEDQDSWFNLLVVHQNRSKHGQTNYLPESFINPIIDLVMWGHEHECRIVPERNAQTGVFITQPGSSVATSLCPGEAVQKQVGLLYIKGRDFRIEPIPSTPCARKVPAQQLLFNSTKMHAFDPIMSSATQPPCYFPRSQALVAAQVELLIERAESQRRPKAPELPLVRLRIDYTGGYETFSGQKICPTIRWQSGQSQGFAAVLQAGAVSESAVPIDSHVTQAKPAAASAKPAESPSSMATVTSRKPDAHIGDDPSLDSVNLDKLIGRWLEQSGAQLSGLGLAVHTYVDNFRRDAMACIAEHQCGRALSFLTERGCSGATGPTSTGPWPTFAA
uniref:Mre11_DNA_bind domain-containing protein n=1 Tax=Macrostomum lignano TaxID=282301 RepID=A0A1I8JNX0_9PLAT